MPKIKETLRSISFYKIDPAAAVLKKLQLIENNIRYFALIM
jgi:hypothetical protein